MNSAKPSDVTTSTLYHRDCNGGEVRSDPWGYRCMACLAKWTNSRMAGFDAAAMADRFWVKPTRDYTTYRLVWVVDPVTGFRHTALRTGAEAWLLEGVYV